MAGGADDGDRQPRKMQGIPLAVGFGIVERPRRHLGRHGQLVGAEIDRAAGLGGDLLYAAHMVKVPVGQQNRFHGQSQSLHLAQHLFRGVAGVDDTAGLRRTVVDDVAVGSVIPKGQRVNVQHTITYFLLGVSISCSVSRIRVTGPSLTDSTFMSAPKRPC